MNQKHIYHPLAQKWLAKMMFKMAEDGLQIVITTHSPNFINLDYLEGIYLVRKNEGYTEVYSTDASELARYCIEKGSHPGKTREETIISFYSGSATENILKGFFANCIVLVEGPSEELALPIYFEKAGLDTLKEGIDIISVGGKGNLAKWWRLFSHFEIPCFVCFDNDAENDENGVKRKDALKTIGIPEEVLDDVLSIKDWNINEQFCVFGKDFENTMRNSFSNYKELEEEIKNELGDSKPIVAREVAKRLNYDENELGWQKMKILVEMVKSIAN